MFYRVLIDAFVLVPFILLLLYLDLGEIVDVSPAGEKKDRTVGALQYMCWTMGPLLLWCGAVFLSLQFRRAMLDGTIKSNVHKLVAFGGLTANFVLLATAMLAPAFEVSGRIGESYAWFFLGSSFISLVLYWQYLEYVSCDSNSL